MKIKLCVLAFMCLFLSCDSDINNETTIAESSIVGLWKLTAAHVENGKIEVPEQGISNTITFSAFGKDFDLLTKFDEDPNTVIAKGKFIAVINVTFEGEIHTDEIPLSTDDLVMGGIKGAWKIIGNQLIITDNEGANFALKILEQSNTILRLEIDFYKEITEEDEVVTISGKLSATFEK